MKALKNAQIITNGKIIRNKSILFNEEIIDLVENIPEGIEIINGQGNYLSPGFIDLHIHGANGYDVMDGANEALDAISSGIVKTGVTDFLPTTMSMEWGKIDKALNCVREYMGHEKGAEVLGVHLEGPFINPKFKGAQKEDAILKPNYELIEKHMDIIKKITYAPELDDNLEFTNRVINESNAILSIGHSDCNMELALETYKLGVRNITHCFNAMRSFHHRAPGIIGAQFIKKYFAEYIADGIHSDLNLLRGFINKVGKETSILITDAMRASLLEKGEFELGGQRVLVDEESARLTDGTLAGSILKINNGVKSIISNEITLQEAIAMVTENPAKAMGLWDKLGSIEKGKKANFVIFDDNINISKVFIKGRMQINAE